MFTIDFHYRTEAQDDCAGQNCHDEVKAFHLLTGFAKNVSSVWGWVNGSDKLDG